jgi:hypothetical protein
VKTARQLIRISRAWVCDLMAMLIRFLADLSAKRLLERYRAALIPEGNQQASISDYIELVGMWCSGRPHQGQEDVREGSVAGWWAGHW